MSENTVEDMNPAAKIDLKVSVVIPMYNASGCITAALDSVLAQTYAIHEIIVVDDGSKDQSADIVKDYCQNHIKAPIILIMQENLGPSAARNNGIMVSTGDVIAFLDSDDSWIDTKIAEQIRVMKTNTEIGLISTRQYRGKVRSAATASQISFFSLLLLNQIITSSVLVRKSVLDRVGLFSDKKYSEDYELWLKIVQKFKVYMLNFGLTCYSRSNSGLSSKLWHMERGELANYSDLLTSHQINIFVYLLVCSLSLTKFFVRFVVSMSRRHFVK